MNRHISRTLYRMLVPVSSCYRRGPLLHHPKTFCSMIERGNGYTATHRLLEPVIHSCNVEFSQSVNAYGSKHSSLTHSKWCYRILFARGYSSSLYVNNLDTTTTCHVDVDLDLDVLYSDVEKLKNNVESRGMDNNVDALVRSLFICLVLVILLFFLQDILIFICKEICISIQTCLKCFVMYMYSMNCNFLLKA